MLYLRYSTQVGTISLPPSTYLELRRTIIRVELLRLVQNYYINLIQFGAKTDERNILKLNFRVLQIVTFYYLSIVVKPCPLVKN